ncbi:MAG: helix-hairpin-helix domain-containing protein [Bacteroidota bacterium]
MKWLTSRFKYSKQQQSGIFFLLVVVVLLLVVSVFQNWRSVPAKDASFFVDKALQHQFDSLQAVSQGAKKENLRPFNPNFISDFKGYTLGMSPEEIDRLHVFRQEDRYINSIAEFQKVTQVSDSVLKMISPFFRFPVFRKTYNEKIANKGSGGTPETLLAKEPIQDLNTATVADLQLINGIGVVLSKRIVKFRNSLGGFLVNEQLYDVYGLEPQVVKRTLKRFQVLNAPKINKININSATVEEIAHLVYFSYDIAENIVTFRKANGKYRSFEDLFNVEGFPVNKIERIALYLSY